MQSDAVTNAQVAAAIEAVANPAWQESFDNTGWQVGDPDAPCTGVLFCVDVTPEIVREAKKKGVNLIVSHHPLLFRGVKSVLPEKGRVEKTLIELIRSGISLYSSHTALDSAPAPYGLSYVMAEKIGLADIQPLTTTPGLGSIGILPQSMSLKEFVQRVKAALDAPCVRLSIPAGGLEAMVGKVAMCSGAGIEFIDDAIAKGADTYITSDVKLNWFLDRRDSINLIEVGHYEAESGARDVLLKVVSGVYPELPCAVSGTEKNPVEYL